MRSSNISRGNSPGFTLIELLVVIAIIAILAAILFPVFAQAREKARQTACLSNVKQMGVAVMMYTQDFDEILPQTGWQGPCTDSTKPNLPATDAAWSGVHAFPTASAPYIKNWNIFACPSDPDRGGWGKQNSYCYEAQLLAVGMPGAYVGMKDVPNAMPTIFPLSYAGNYYLNKVYTGRGNALEMYSVAEIRRPTNVFYLCDVGSSISGGNAFAGWYIIPGYGQSTASKVDRRDKGRRHAQGRNWAFCDGHAKWYKDPEDNTLTDVQLLAAYRKRGIYTDPTWETD